jgi:hypothetical protein
MKAIPANMSAVDRYRHRNQKSLRRGGAGEGEGASGDFEHSGCVSCSE